MVATNGRPQVDDRLTAALRSRIDAYLTTNDLEMLRSADAAAEAKRVMRRSRQDPEVLSLLALFYWYRYDPETGVEDLATAVELSNQLRASNPGLRPPMLADILDFIDQVVAGEDLVLDIDEADEDRLAIAGLFFNLAGLWWTGYSDTGDAALLDRAIAAMDTTLDLTPDESPGHLSAMTLLGAYLRARGDPDALDAAVALLREALERAGPGHEIRADIHRFLIGALYPTHEREGSADAMIAFAEAAIGAIEELGLDDPVGHDIAQLAGALFPVSDLLGMRSVILMRALRWGGWR
jgi:hypothetical protein